MPDNDAEVLVEDSWFLRADLPSVLGNFMRSNDALMSEVKDFAIRVEKAEAAVTRVRALLDNATTRGGLALDGSWMLTGDDAWISVEHLDRALGVSDADHTVAWQHEGEDIRGRITCTAAEGAACRLTCPEGHECWPCGHDLVDGGECNPTVWAEADDILLTYDGLNGAVVRNGPVEFEWQGDYYTWDYVDG